MAKQLVHKACFNSEDLAKLHQIKLFIESNLEKELKIELLATMFSLSTSTMRRHFALHYQKPIYQFILDCRMKKAKELIVGCTLRFNELSVAVGYKRYTSFHHAFSKYYGNAPSFFSNNSSGIVNGQN